MPLSKESIFNKARNAELSAGHLIKGQPNGLNKNNKLENHTPIDNTLIGHIANADIDTVDAAVKVARDSFNSGEWSKLSPADRKKIIIRWADLIQEHSEELAALDCIDAGKPIDECLKTDIPDTIATFNWYAEIADKCFGKVAPTGSSSLGIIIKEPIGVVATVLPWNFPAMMFAWKVAPALATGNSVIVKPAELTSLSAYKLVQLAYEAGIPEGSLSLVCGLGETAGKAIGLHNDIDMISFTGSTEVGRLFLSYSAQSNLKEIVLECGGKSPQVIFEDALLEQSIEHILSAAFWNMGENCSCGSRIIVHESIKSKLLEKLVTGLKIWQPGIPTKHGINAGPMVGKAHFEKVISFIKSAKSSGAKLVSGGNILSNIGSGWYIEPTIFENVSEDDRLFQEEIFGPIIAVTTFKSEEQAINLANNSKYGLAASIYTQNIKRAHRVSSAIKAGTISINAFSEGNISTPFGGYKQSGFGGRDNGTEALDQYLETKTIWIEN